MTPPLQTELVRRVEALDVLVAEGAGLLDDDALEDAAALAERAASRLRHGTSHTVVALAGATGSGKSSLFNAIVGAEVAAVGVTRPTTSHARAAVFGTEPAGDLLDWVGVRHRHGVAEQGLDGLVLLDLPDHDSIATDHRLEVDRLVEVVDLMVWVLDPQKYADEALHDRYLAPLSGHGDSLIFALNQADRVRADDRTRWRAHAIDILQADGIAAPVVVVTSATTGEGVDALRTVLADRIAARDAALLRLGGDLAAVAAAAGPVPAAPSGRSDRARRELSTALAEAAGASIVADAVARGYRFDAARATGWPFARWLLRFRRHPLRALRPAPQRSSAPETAPTAIPVDEPRLDMAVRSYADAAVGDVAPSWAREARLAAAAQKRELVAALGRQITGVAAAAVRPPHWWAALRRGQWLLGAGAVGGAAWLAVLAVLGYLQVPTDDVTPHLGSWPVPTLMLIGGAIAGAVLAWLARIPAAVGAGRRARSARVSLAAGLESTAEDYVIKPVAAEMERWERIAAGLDLIAGRDGARPGAAVRR